MTYRMAGMFISYLTFSIKETPVIPYGVRFICFAFNGIYRNRFGRSKPLPYANVSVSHING